ncbi:acyloxyacyl hydrolase [Namhaeicola litoreus]|uniref:Acyloxyacyl hydrolase n=1 Tax=Namhaeicola litoreus TaxID=1052145 RepID=A0ABW3XZQ6_9FLAO
MIFKSFGQDTLKTTQFISRPQKTSKYNLELQSKFEFGGVITALEERGIYEYYGTDMRMGFRKKENNAYSTLYRSPVFGIGFYAGTFKDNVFGNPYAIDGFVDIPVMHMPDNWEWIYSLGLGLATNFNFYDPIKNPTNEIIGSRRNVYIALSTELRYYITPHWKIGAGAGFKHFSNGRLRLPNKSINVLPFSVMASYNFNDEKTVLDKSKISEFIPFNMFSFFGAVGNRNFEYGKADYFKSTLSANFLHQFQYKYRFGLGFELFYTAGALDRVTEDKTNFKKQFSYGVVGLWEWVLTDRIYVPLNVGVYLNRNEENEESAIYKRLGFRYLIGQQKKLFVGLSLKVTETRSDYIEWTLGYTFKKDPNNYQLLY